MRKLLYVKSNNLFEKSKRVKEIDALEIFFPKYDISKFGLEFLKFVNLKELFIQSDINNKKLLPNEIGRLNSLKKLYILNFNYSTFPDWILNLKNIKHLMIRGNDISRIPSEIEQLKFLEKVRIENCDLNSLPNTLFNLNRLRELSLAENRKLIRFDINVLPKNLSVLNLSGTGITRGFLEEIELKRPRLLINKFVD